MLKQFSSFCFVQQLRQFNSFKRIINLNSQQKCLIHLSGQKQSNIQHDEPIATNSANYEQILEYYECYEEDEVQLLPEIEPYLRKDLPLRKLSTIRPDEIIEVLKDQRAKEISFFESEAKSEVEEDENDEKPPQEDNFRPYNPFTIICSPYNKRHGKALMTIMRAFVKRNFFFENHESPSRRLDKDISGWYVLHLDNVTVHIIEEELRKKYDLESLILGIDNEEPTNWWETNEYAVPNELLANIDGDEKKEKKPRKLRGMGNDPFIRPLR